MSRPCNPYGCVPTYRANSGHERRVVYKCGPRDAKRYFNQRKIETGVILAVQPLVNRADWVRAKTQGEGAKQ